jgi:hypothetical protein
LASSEVRGPSRRLRVRCRTSLKPTSSAWRIQPEVAIRFACSLYWLSTAAIRTADCGRITRFASQSAPQQNPLRLDVSDQTWPARGRFSWRFHHTPGSLTPGASLEVRSPTALAGRTCTIGRCQLPIHPASTLVVVFAFPSKPREIGEPRPCGFTPSIPTGAVQRVMTGKNLVFLNTRWLKDRGVQRSVSAEDGNPVNGRPTTPDCINRLDLHLKVMRRGYLFPWRRSATFRRNGATWPAAFAPGGAPGVQRCLSQVCSP